MTLMTLERLGVRLGGRPVVEEVDLRVGPGELVGLIGPNGAGKTSLMRAALGLLPFNGSSDLAALSPADRARRVAWMPQSREIAWPVSVETLVSFGRLPHGPAGLPADRMAVEAALERMELGPLRHRPATDISGGERACALFARALAQDTPLLLADEPAAGLDPAHQVGLMRLLSELTGEGRGILVSMHDLGLALRHCTRLVLLDHGRKAADGVPRDVLTAELLSRVFGVRAHLSETEDGPIFQVLDTLR
ncbi:ABC transporter ATP-binding protein [Roseitranquillus sediminis]|uniref:ABC transporter ATP-binding protein n=1 Tax=Roseitranquillus sediminis TaxID=2809051 RepID=UPI001D0CD40B|nr:ABC transporter ATP-binding protein [Roseitranquillus sediminis]MBM9593049.1 ABC transporter ATP-binding protein [Roseitranquillus sediminis]